MSKIITANRLIVLGRNSKVWQLLHKSNLLVDLPVVAIGHKELATFTFLPGDNVWVFSYSHSVSQNSVLLKYLAKQKKISVVYVSSASTNVTSITRCYKYPTVKQLALEDAVRLCNAQIINIGWFYSTLTDLPPGSTAATSVYELAIAIRNSKHFASQFFNLFHMVDRPFNRRFEKIIYQWYGRLIAGCGHYPCLLRPLDLALRILGMRWYGYLYLSNRLWSSTI